MPEKDNASQILEQASDMMAEILFEQIVNGKNVNEYASKQVQNE